MEDDIFMKKIYCIIAIELGRFEVVESGLTFNKALERKVKLDEITPDVYFVDLTLSAQNALKKYKESIKKYNNIFMWGVN